MKTGIPKRREEARRMFLSGDVTTNAEIAARIKVKAHTVGRWRRDEDWDGLRLKVDRRAAEMFVDKIATDRVSLNVRHYRVWDFLLGRLLEDMKSVRAIDSRELERLAGVMERAQKGQRLAKGMSLSGETEETIRAESQAEIRGLIDRFVDAVKENVQDEEIRERIRQAVLRGVHDETDAGSGESEDEG